jgi:hypothetical protein
MAKIIRINAGRIEANAELTENKTAQAVWDGLPIKAQAETWGDEIYFSIPVHLELDDGQEVVKAGDLGYWPPGNAFCIFFGTTPVSKKNEIRPASPVNVFGKITGNPRVFGGVKSGTDISITRIEKE